MEEGRAPPCSSELPLPITLLAGAVRCSRACGETRRIYDGVDSTLFSQQEQLTRERGSSTDRQKQGLVMRVS